MTATGTGTHERPGAVADGASGSGPSGDDTPGSGPSGDDTSAAVRRRRIRRALPLAVLAVATVVVAVIITPRPDSGLPLDPASTRPDGTAALVAVLGELGTRVTVVDPDDGRLLDAPVALVLRDQFTEDERRRLRGYVNAGGRVVVADPGSPLAPDVAASVPLLEPTLRRSCDLPALGDVDEVRPDGAVFDVDDDAVGCFVTDAGAWLVVTPARDGTIVALGDPGPLTNAQLTAADHAVLAVQLLTPRGADAVAVVRPVVRTVEDGADAGLADLIGDDVRAFGAQLMIGFLVVVAWRARRLGRPLTERSAVRLPASELTAAVGALLARHGARAAAQRRVRDDVRGRLTRMLGLPPDAAVDHVARRAADRTDVTADRVGAALRPPDPGDDDALLRATRALDDLERSVHQGLDARIARAATPDTPGTHAAAPDTTATDDRPRSP